jgi:biopolymer transport protein ExbB
VPAPGRVTQLEQNSASASAASGLRTLNANPRCTEVDLRAAMESTGRNVAHKLERYLSALATIARQRPCGLLGTWSA